MFTVKRKVRYSECQGDGKLSIPGIVNHFQDTSTEHSESLGVGVNYMKSIHHAWILASWQIILCRRPEIGEEIEVQTWPTSFKGIYGERNYMMKTYDGEVLAYANSIWLYWNTDSMRPEKPSKEHVERYQNEEPYEMDYAPRKIHVNDTEGIEECLPIRKWHLDTNNHVNNSKYVELAMEYLPEDFQTQQLRVEYKKAALLGDVVIPQISKENKRIVIELCDGDGNPFAVTEWIGE